VFLFATALAAGGATSVAAQQTTQTPPRPSKGLFADKKSSTADRQTLNLNVTFTEAYDDDVTAEGGPSIGANAAQLSGYYSMLVADADYGWRGRRAQIGLSGSSALRYYQQLKTVKAASSSVGAGFTANLSKRTTWSFNQTAAYSPSYFYGLFPSLTPTVAPGDLPATAAPNYTFNSQESYSYGTSTTLSTGVGRRGALSVTADYGSTNFVKQITGRLDTRSYGVRTFFARNLTRNMAVRMGYHFRRSDIGVTGGGVSTEHGVDVGVDTVRPLSATRKATFSFNVGSSALEVPSALISGRPEDREVNRLYRVSADVSAGYQFRRTWQARATYRRGMDYVAVLTGPVFTDATSASVEGLFTRRMDFNFSVGYSNGKSALFNSSAYSTYTGDVRLRYALTRNWALFSEYLYYYYDFSGVRQLLRPDIASGLTRNGVRAGITLWVPALGR